MNWKRVAAGLVVALSLTAWVRADEPKTTATTRPSAQAIPEDPAVASGIKSMNPKQQQQFLDRHEGFLKDKEEAMKKGPIQFVLIGDSITDGWRGSGKAVFAEAFGKYNPYNIGIGGDRTQHVLWRIDNGELDGLDPNPKVAMIMIGTNNLGPNKSNEKIIDGIEKIVKEVHEKLPQTKILLLGIFPRGRQADEPLRARIKDINDTIAKLDGSDNVKYLDIGDKFLDSDGKIPNDVMPDASALHPNAKGYQIWADAVKPTLDDLMK